jgi:hypothetical protein
MIRPTRVVVYLAALAAMSGRTIAGPKIYSNPEFGIHLAVPNEDLLCPTVKDQHDHGFGMLLGGGSPKDCHEDAHHRSIWLFAFFNVLDDTKYLSGLLSMGCDAAGGRCQPGPANLQIPGRSISAGRVNLPDGWIVLVVATQAGGPAAFEPKDPSVNYLFSLHTRPEYLDQDLLAFRTILQTVRLSPAGK